MYRIHAFLLGTILAWTSAVASASDAVHQHRLDNGLNILVVEDPRAGVVTSMLWYHVGSGQEYRPLTGISHAVEHMMFKGTEVRETGEFSRLIAREGGRHNAFTGRDFTGYFQTLAADRLELAFELEAERMHRLVFDDDEFQREMEVIREERRQRVDDPPQARAFERFNATAHMANPYRHPIIGWERDLDRLQIEELEAWYERWYAPANATLVVVGAVTADEVFALAEKHFGAVPDRDPEPQPEGREIAQPPGERRIDVTFADARLPLLYMAFNVPSLATAEQPEDAYALMMAAELLDGGRSARIPTELVRGQALASSAGARYTATARLDTLFTLSGHPAAEHSLDDLEAAFREQIERLHDEPPTEEEIERAVRRLLASEVYQRDSTSGQAHRLGQLEATGIGWQEVERFEARIRAIEPEDIQRVAQRYLQPERLTIGRLHTEEQS